MLFIVSVMLFLGNYQFIGLKIPSLEQYRFISLDRYIVCFLQSIPARAFFLRSHVTTLITLQSYQEPPISRSRRNSVQTSVDYLHFSKKQGVYSQCLRNDHCQVIIT